MVCCSGDVYIVLYPPFPPSWCVVQVTRADEGEYRCIAVLTGVNDYTIGTSQPPTRTSLPIPLVITDQCKYLPVQSTRTSLTIPLVIMDQCKYLPVPR